MANSVDTYQTTYLTALAVWSGSALFAYAILSENLGYEILGHLPQQNIFWLQYYYIFLNFFLKNAIKDRKVCIYKVIKQ